MKNIFLKANFALALLLALAGAGCKKFLDVVPDNVPTVQHAFNVSTEAERYVYTCYSYLPNVASLSENPAFLGGDEFWMNPEWTNYDRTPLQIAMGFQSAANPYMSIWEEMYKALRDCNIFLDNIGQVPDAPSQLRQRWIGEVKFLKAYYHWMLLRAYGPVPVMDESLDVGDEIETLQVHRQPVDSVVNLIVRLLDESVNTLPAEITNRKDEMGRITKPIALSIKAKVLVTAASPLFNGNPDYANVYDKDGKTLLFNPTYDASKWERAALACKEAIKACEDAGFHLHTYNDPSKVLDNDELKVQMSLRHSITQRWNNEQVWGSSNSRGDLGFQRFAMPRLNPSFPENESNVGQLAPTMKMAELFYTKNGVPINEDKTWNYAGRYSLREATSDDDVYISEGYRTASLHFDREPRFYSSIAFDGGKWFMFDGNYTVEAKFGQNQSQKNINGYSMTGYFAKKLVSWKYVIKENYGISSEDYSWPIMRLADLYLLYAEALNEWHGAPNEDALHYINMVRARAGLKTVQEAWSQFAANPGKFATKEGFRDIVQQERLIELAFEGHRFWDLRRWKRSLDVVNEPVRGWDIVQQNEAFYYRPVVLFQQTFQQRDYLWPIHRNDILVNPNLVQNPGW